MGGSAASVTEGYSELTRRKHHVGVDRHPFQLLDSIRQRNGSDLGSLQGDHRTQCTLVDAAHGGGSKSECEIAVVSDRRPASLDMTKHQAARFLAGHLLDVCCKLFSDSTVSP